MLVLMGLGGMSPSCPEEGVYPRLFVTGSLAAVEECIYRGGFFALLFFLAANYQAQKIMTLNVNLCISPGD